MSNTNGSKLAKGVVWGSLAVIIAASGAISYGNHVAATKISERIAAYNAVSKTEHVEADVSASLLTSKITLNDVVVKFAEGDTVTGRFTLTGVNLLKRTVENSIRVNGTNLVSSADPTVSYDMGVMLTNDLEGKNISYLLTTNGHQIDKPFINFKWKVDGVLSDTNNLYRDVADFAKIDKTDKKSLAMAKYNMFAKFVGSKPKLLNISASNDGFLFDSAVHRRMNTEDGSSLTEEKATVAVQESIDSAAEFIHSIVKESSISDGFKKLMSKEGGTLDVRFEQKVDASMMAIAAGSKIPGAAKVTDLYNIEVK